MKSRFVQLFAIVAGVGLLAGTAVAHHGDAGRYNSYVTTVTGTVVAFQLLSPHSQIVLDVEENGEAVRWRGEWGNAVGLAQRGITRDTIKPGDTLTMRGRALRSGQPYMILTVCALLVDGQGNEIFAGEIPEDDPNCENIPGSTGGVGN